MKRRVLAALYDGMNKGPEAAGIRGERHELLAQAQGTTIEIGAGTGLNLEHCPGSVTRLVLAEHCLEGEVDQLLSELRDGAGLGDLTARRQQDLEVEGDPTLERPCIRII